MKLLNINCWLPVSHCYYSVNIVSFSLHGSDPIRRVPIFRIPWNRWQYAEMNQLAMREFLFNLKILNWLKFRNIKTTLPLVSNQLHYSGSCYFCFFHLVKHQLLKLKIERVLSYSSWTFFCLLCHFYVAFQKNVWHSFFSFTPLPLLPPSPYKQTYVFCPFKKDMEMRNLFPSNWLIKISKRF